MTNLTQKSTRFLACLIIAGFFSAQTGFSDKLSDNRWRPDVNQLVPEGNKNRNPNSDDNTTKLFDSENQKIINRSQQQQKNRDANEQDKLFTSNHVLKVDNSSDDVALFKGDFKKDYTGNTAEVYHHDDSIGWYVFIGVVLTLGAIGSCVNVLRHTKNRDFLYEQNQCK